MFSRTKISSSDGTKRREAPAASTVGTFSFVEVGSAPCWSRVRSVESLWRYVAVLNRTVFELKTKPLCCGG
ncbi:hypothetical protein TYRP_006271 [Tyrophagus putrescentiae]|nr:hypothetical protein TYRP_006271 [Tyrophagus putrescentiae]